MTKVHETLDVDKRFQPKRHSTMAKFNVRPFMSRHRARYDSRLQQSSTFDARFPVTRTSQLIDATTRDVGALQRIDQFVMAIRKSSSMSAIKYSNFVSVNCWFVSMHEFRVNFVPTPEFVLQSDDVPSV